MVARQQENHVYGQAFESLVRRFGQPLAGEDRQRHVLFVWRIDSLLVVPRRSLARLDETTEQPYAVRFRLFARIKEIHASYGRTERYGVRGFRQIGQISLLSPPYEFGSDQ